MKDLKVGSIVIAFEEEYKVLEIHTNTIVALDSKGKLDLDISDITKVITDKKEDKMTHTVIETIKEEMVSTLIALEGADNSSKSLFNNNVKYLASTSDINVGVKALKALVVEVTADYTSYYKGKLNTIINYSTIACNSKLAIDTNLMHWYNVEKSLKLMEHLLEHYTNDVNTIRNLLNSLKGKSKGITQRVDKNKYNDLLATKLSELYKEYKLEEDDDKKSVKIETMFQSLDIEHKKAIIAKLQGMIS